MLSAFVLPVATPGRPAQIEGNAVMSEQYRPGDVVKGQILLQTGEWVSVRTLYSQDPTGAGTAAVAAGGPSTAKKWAMAFVYIVLAGWIGMGTVFALATWRIGSRFFGDVPDIVLFILGDIGGIAMGVWWFGGWLAKAQARTGR